MKKRIQYVLGFLFDPTLTRVAMLRKNKPAHLEGLLLGVGGKIDAGESPRDAMEREFHEEAWPSKEKLDWKEFCVLTWKSDHHPQGTDMVCFCATGNIWAARSLTAETIEIWEVNDVMNRPDTVGNVRWLVQMARSSYFDPKFPGYRVEAVNFETHSKA